ncbi:MAG: fumarate hydratase [Anaerolineales bacterium]|nr:fumarate hydratase [Anaerolineales bacterium]
MEDLTPAFLELVRRTATDLPPDVEAALVSAMDQEETGSAAHGVLTTILENVELARGNSTPICQDTGTPIFFVQYPQSMSTRKLRRQISAAVEQATKNTFLRPNAVDSITGINSGNNLGDDAFPTIHFEEIDGTSLIVDLILKGGGCENVSAQYSLPNSSLAAGRDLEGVRKVVLDAVLNAQGKGCAPGILGVAVGGDRGSSYVASKEALLRKVEDENSDPDLNDLENQLMEQTNLLGIGPMGLGGKSTVLGVKIKGMHRLPASFFVSVAYMCWAHRRRRMVIQGDEVAFD